MVELSDSLAHDFDETSLVRNLADRCVEVLDVDASGVVLVRPQGGPLVVASPRDAGSPGHGLVRLQLWDGPCADCLRTGEWVEDRAIAESGTRWPRFEAEAYALGFRSVSGTPLRVHGRSVGALSLLRTAEGPLGATDQLVAQSFAEVATIAILQHRAAIQARTLNDNLTSALESRIVIEQAKGILAERVGSDVDSAFAVMRNHARNHNVRLSELARRVVEGSVDVASFDPLR